MTLWDVCEGSAHIHALSIKPWRVVEAQHILSARDLVDSREEHDVLEALLEDSKPSITKDKPYLIFTPFRYPPLKYGSRFGRAYEPSLWYGSLSLKTAFTEVAYYRFQFLHDTTADLGYLDISMTAFTAFIQTQNGIDLCQPPFDNYREAISSKHDYTHSQPLGTAMRAHNVHAFLYYSARTSESKKNVAVFHPSVFRMKHNLYINDQQTWLCVASKHTIEFTRIGILGRERLLFSYEKQGSYSD